MIKTILLAATVALSAAPAFAQAPKNQAAFGAFSSYEAPPSIAMSAIDVPSTIYCRVRARTKFFELSARNMSEPDSNSQWGIVGNNQALVWCRGTQAIIGVAGNNINTVNELRNELKSAF